MIYYPWSSIKPSTTNISEAVSSASQTQDQKSKRLHLLSDNNNAGDNGRTNKNKKSQWIVVVRGFFTLPHGHRVSLLPCNL